MGRSKSKWYWVRHHHGRTGYGKDALEVTARQPIDAYAYVLVSAVDAADARRAFRTWSESGVRSHGSGKRRRTASAGGWTKVKRGSIKEFRNAIWQRKLGGDLRAIIETLIPLGTMQTGPRGRYDLAQHSKVKVWLMLGRTAMPESPGSSLTRGPYWSVEEAKNMVDTHYPRRSAGGKKPTRASKLGTVIADINRLVK